MKYTQIKQAGYWQRLADGWNMLVHPIDNWNEWGRDLVKREVNDIAGSAGRSFGEQAAAGIADQAKKEGPGLVDSASKWIGDKFKGGMSQGAAALGGAAAGGLLGYGLGSMGGKNRKLMRTLATMAGTGLGALGGYWLYDKLGKKASMKYSDVLKMRKAAALGLEPDPNNLTERFADWKKRQNMQMTGAMFGGLGAAMAAGVNKLRQGPGATEKLPDYDPETGVYIGKSYKVPESEEARAALYKNLTGADWEATAPRWMDNWLIEPRKERIMKALRKKLANGEAANSKKLSPGELASVLMPEYVLKQDGSIATGPYPAKGWYKETPITKADIDQYLAEQRVKRASQQKEAADNLYRAEFPGPDGLLVTPPKGSGPLNHDAMLHIHKVMQLVRSLPKTRKDNVATFTYDKGGIGNLATSFDQAVQDKYDANAKDPQI